MTKPNEPTLTCSEVVERLTQLGYKTAWLAYESPRDANWFRAEATKVLHSWRERRVQELEEALEHLVVLIGTKSTFTKTDRQVVELAVRAHGGIRNIFEEEV